MIMSFLAKQIEAQAGKGMDEGESPQLPILVCSVFCSDSDADQRNATGVVRSLLFQILSQRHDLVRHAAPLILNFSSGREILFGQLWQVLKAVLNDPTIGYVYIVIDAIDKCTEDTRNMFLDALSQYMGENNGSAAGGGKVILSSRPLVTITDIINPQTAILRLWEHGRPSMITQDIGLVIKEGIKQLLIRTGASKTTIAILKDKLTVRVQSILNA